MNRARNISRIYQYDRIGITSAEILGVPDARQCERCAALDGTVHTVSDLVGAADRIVNAVTPEELIAVSPFINSIDMETNEFVLATGQRVSTDASSDVLAKLGIVTPFHGGCYSKNTEIYTRNGWEYFKTVEVGNEVLSLNPETKDLEWAKVKYKIKKHAEKINVLTNKRNSFYMEVSEDHPYFGYNRVQRSRQERPLLPVFYKDISELTSEFRFYNSSEWVGKEREEIEINGLIFNTDDFCKFMGYYLSEGSAMQRGPNRYMTSIAQEKHLEEMYEDISRLDHIDPRLGKGKIYISNQSLTKYLLQFGHSYKKFIPEWIKELSPRQIRIFLTAFALGDGHIKKGKTWNGGTFRDMTEFYTSSNRMASDLGELLVKVGKSCSYTKILCGGKEQTFKNGTYIINRDVWNIRELNTSHRHFSHLTVTSKEYNDFVYDVELDKNHTLLTRCRGRVIWGSNCRCQVIVWTG